MIILYGKLREKFGEVINCKVNSVRELVRAAEANRPGFVGEIERDGHYMIKRGDEFRRAKAVGEEEVEMTFSEHTWHVLPMPAGASGVARVILGAVLIVVGAVLTYTGTFSAIGVPMMKWGAAIAFSGVASMLAPSPTAPDSTSSESADERPSFLFDGPTNRTADGGARPIVLGDNVWTGSVFISGGIDVGDMA